MLPVVMIATEISDFFPQLPEDVQNYRYMVTMRGRAKLKPGVLPHIFNCQGKGVGTNNNRVALQRKRRIIEHLEGTSKNV